MSFAEKGIIIRKTLESDLRGIYLMASEAREFSLKPLTAEELADIFTSGNSVMYSAVRKKHVLGFIAGRIKGIDAAAEAVYVKEKFRCMGIGSSLLENFINRADRAGAESFSITLPGENQKALNFFLSRGFIQTGSNIRLRINNK